MKKPNFIKRNMYEVYRLSDTEKKRIGIFATYPEASSFLNEFDVVDRKNLKIVSIFRNYVCN